LFKLIENKIFAKLQEREKRKMMFDPQNVKIVCENWAIEVMLPTMSQIIAERFILRKQNLKRAQVVGRRI